MEWRKTVSNEEQEQEAKHIGEKLRQRRKEMNLTLKEVENNTSIRQIHLEAIEDGHFTKLPSPIYTQGFFKQYTAFLGIDGDQIVKENLPLFNRTEAQEFSYGIGTLEARTHPGAYVKWFPNFLWIIGLGLMLLTAWYVARFLEIL